VKNSVKKNLKVCILYQTLLLDLGLDEFYICNTYNTHNPKHDYY